jgi:hypothetical protein
MAHGTNRTGVYGAMEPKLRFAEFGLGVKVFGDKDL